MNAARASATSEAGPVATHHASTGPRRLNALTFEVYRELTDTLPRPGRARPTCAPSSSPGRGRAFCTGGDVREIIGELLEPRPDRRCSSSRASPATSSAPCARCRSRSWPRSTGRWRGREPPSRSPPTCAIAAETARIAFLFVKVGLAGRRHGRGLPAAADGRPGTRHRAAHDRATSSTRRRRCASASTTAWCRADRLDEETRGPRPTAWSAAPPPASPPPRTRSKREMHMDLEAALEPEAARPGRADDGARLPRRVRRPSCEKRPPRFEGAPGMTLAADPFLERPAPALAREGPRLRREAPARQRRGRVATRRAAPARSCAGLAERRAPAPPPCRAPYGAMDLRSLVVVREALAYFSSLADTAFAMQGLGSYAVSRAGTEVQKNRWLPAVVSGELLARLRGDRAGGGLRPGRRCARRRERGRRALAADRA